MLRIKIDPCSAHVTFLKEFEHDKKQAKRFAIWLSLAILNPSEKIITVSEFELKFKNNKKRWSKSLVPITFPSVPRQAIGESIKFLPVYFTRFSELENIFGKEFFPDGKIKPGESQSGYLLFLEEYFGTWLPHVTKKGIQIKIKCKDLRGKAYETKGWARSLSTEKAYEYIPRLEEYKEGEKYLSSLIRWEESIDMGAKEGIEIMNKIKELEKRGKQ